MNKKTFLAFVFITVFFTACGEKAAARDVMGENDGTLFGNANETVSGDAASEVPDVTFFDDSGEAPKTASAGDIIVPVSFGQSCVGFESSKGEFLGYLYISEKDAFDLN